MTTDEAAIEAMARANDLAMAAGWLVGATDGQHQLRSARQAVLDKTRAYIDATAALAALREMEGRDG